MDRGEIDAGLGCQGPNGTRVESLLRKDPFGRVEDFFPRTSRIRHFTLPSSFIEGNHTYVLTK